MLRDNAIKSYRGQAYDIPQKPIENGQYINKNGLLAAILKIREIIITSIVVTCFEIMLLNFTGFKPMTFLRSLLKMGNI